MAAFIDLFDGPDNTALTSRAGWVGISGSDDVLLLNGAGAVKDTGAGYEKSVGHDTGGQAHYVKAVVGAGFVANANADVQLVVGTGVGVPRWGLGYRSGTGLLRLRTNGSGGDEDLAVGCAVGDELVLEWDYAAGSLVIKKNGATIATKSWAGSPFSGTYTGILVASGRTAQDDVFRSFETNVIGGEPADTEAPTLTGSITVGAKTSSSITMSWPAGSDNVGVTAYEVSSNGGTSWTDVGNVLTHTFTGLTALTSYGLRVRAKDAAGLTSTPLAATTSTYRAGALASTVLLLTGPQDGNPAGFLYAFAGTVQPGDWLSWRTVSGPVPAGGELDANAMGAFAYQGPSPATLVIQPEVNGVDAAETITVTLYDQGGVTTLTAGADTAASVDAGGAIQLGPVELAASIDIAGCIDMGASILIGDAVFTADVDTAGASDAGGAISLTDVVLLSEPDVAGSLDFGAQLLVFVALSRSPSTVAYRDHTRARGRFIKAPGEVLDFDVDFGDELRGINDDARAVGAIDTQVPSGIVLIDAYWVPETQCIKLWFGGGKDQKTYDCTVWLNTRDGRRLETDIRIKVRD